MGILKKVFGLSLFLLLGLASLCYGSYKYNPFTGNFDYYESGGYSQEIATITAPSGYGHITISTPIAFGNIATAGTDVMIDGSNSGLTGGDKWINFGANNWWEADGDISIGKDFCLTSSGIGYLQNLQGTWGQDLRIIPFTAAGSYDIRAEVSTNHDVIISTNTDSPVEYAKFYWSGSDKLELDMTGYANFRSSITVGNYHLPSSSGTLNQILKQAADGMVTWQNDATAAGGGDDLGNHTATETLKMANFGIENINWSTSDDGTGSGLDADLLDGSSSAAFLSTTTADTTYLTKSSATATYQHTNANLDDLADGTLSASKVEDKFLRNYEDDTTNFQLSISTIVGTNAIKMNAVQWNTGDSIDGEQIGADTIDDDSIDFGSGDAVDTDDIPEGASNLYQLTQEETEDYAGTMISSGTGTHTRISITYQDATGDMDFVVDDMNDDVPEAEDYSNLTAGDLIDHSVTGTIAVSSAAVTNGDTTHAPNCDQVYDFCETTQGYYNSGDSPSFGSGSFSGQVTSNGRKLVDEYDFAVCISTPNALGVVATLISPFRNYAVTITTISAQIIGGTNVVLQIEQRTIAGIESAGTDLWTGDVTALPTNWIGGTASDFTVPAGSALVLVPTSVSGDVDRLMIKWRFTKD